jgi:O-antigen/teichoic acid export membrane protein
VRVFAAEALMVPSGLIVAAYLARRLEPDGYGLFVLALTITVWVEWSVVSLFARQTIKLVSEADDWRGVGAAAVRQSLFASLLAGVALCVAAYPLAHLLGAPALGAYLCLFALDIPLFALARTHRNILVGLEETDERALVAAARWIVRPILIVLLVECGLSIPGAIMGSLCATLAELLLLRRYVRPSFARPRDVPARTVWRGAAPLALAAMSLRLFNRIDLIALKALGGTAVAAGIYGAAQQVALLPNLFGLSFAPLLMATLARLLRRGKLEEARQTAGDAMRAVMLLLPLASLVAGCAPEIAPLLFGAKFASAALPLAVLIFGALALLMVSVATSIFTAASLPSRTFQLTAPLVIVAAVGHLFAIPRFGLIGAAIVTTVVATFGALVAVLLVYQLWRVAPPRLSVLRAALVSVAAYLLVIYIPTTGWWVALKLCGGAALCALALLSLGEFTKQETALLRSLARRKRTT